MKWAVFFILMILAGAAGAVAGSWLRPDPAGGSAPAKSPSAGPAQEPAYYRIPNQFVVPLVEGGRVASVILMALTLEIRGEGTEQVIQHEPRLRDEFLRVLFDHANAGGFRGNFTAEAQMTHLRGALRETARKILPGVVEDILITDILRQDN